MKNILLSPFKNISIWIDIFVVYFVSLLMYAFDISWYYSACIALISAVVIAVFVLRNIDGYKKIRNMNKSVKLAIKKAKKNADTTYIYDVLEDKALAAVRKEIPRKIYKYYPLSIESKRDEERLNSLKNRSIWASTCGGFNDPYECRYLYLTDNDISEIGISNAEEGKRIWDSIMGVIQQRITMICFTQNPNDMPMWAHYANEHKGFCVEYEVLNDENLYPVFYTDRRLKAQNTFINLVYYLMNEEKEKNSLGKLLKYIMLTSAHKDKSWESEHEIRAIFMKSTDNMESKGRLFDFETIGIRPTHLYIGVNCGSENTKKLIEIANELNIEYEKCTLYDDNQYHVIKA